MNFHFSAVFSLLFLLSFSIYSQNISDQAAIDPQDVEIVRDQWGVPHIYGKTDADAVYGFKWAQCEDDFESIQHAMLAVRGRLSSILGKEGAIFDVASFLLQNDQLIRDSLEAKTSPEFRKILAAGVQAINDYAEAHPEEVLVKKLFPINHVDIMQGYSLGQSFLSNALFGAARLIENKLETYSMEQGTGSNSIALNRKMMKEDETCLLINPHNLLEGPIAWYEAHINSEEGWNMLGGTFSTGLTIFLGSNPDLAWAHTVNYPDLHDIYKLEMHPKDKHTYRFDGEWLPLEELKLKLKVKVGFIRLPVTLKFYKSKYGITIKNKSGYYSIRFPAAFNLKAAEQWYRMNKASNLDQFTEAVKMTGLSSMNILYADKEDNIFYLSGGQFPERDPSYNWQGILPGDTSATLWQPEYKPVDVLPWIQNPECGYVYNMNNTPFSATCRDEDLKPGDFDATLGFDSRETNRSLRFQELMGAVDQLSLEELKRIKYDKQYNSETLYTQTIENLDIILQLNPEQYPKIADELAVLHKWNRNSDPTNEQAALVAVGIYYMVKYLENEIAMDRVGEIPEEVYVESIKKAGKHMRKHFGSLEVPLGQVQVHARGDVVLPVGGMAEQLAAMFPQPYSKGRFRSAMGDSYIQIVRFGEDGQKIESVHPYGASNKKGSAHYTDQMSLYTNSEMKEMTLDKQTIYQNAERIYHPGQE